MKIQVTLSIAFALWSVGVVASAENHVRTLDWSELKASGELDAGEVVAVKNGDDSSDVAPREELLLINDSQQPLTVRLATLEPTGVKKHVYRIHGQIRYEDVKEPGHLESWNHFANSGPAFTKTLAASGPMGKIHGTSSLREFILPFQGSPQVGPPTRIEVNLVLPAEGKVWISPMHLEEFDESESGAANSSLTAWWSNRTSGLFGGIMGSVLGVLGAVIGTLSGRGRGKAVCLGICWFALCCGILSLIVGVIAVTQSQPYGVYYPLLLLGGISTVVMGGMIPQLRKRYADLEIHRMEAMDAGPV